MNSKDCAGKRAKGEAFASYHTGSEEMTVWFYPNSAGIRMTITHNWCDGKHRPLTRSWRTKALLQLGFVIARWNKTDWGEQAEFVSAKPKLVSAAPRSVSARKQAALRKKGLGSPHQLAAPGVLKRR
jgi:hypothetical protein